MDRPAVHVFWTLSFVHIQSATVLMLNFPKSYANLPSEKCVNRLKMVDEQSINLNFLVECPCVAKE
jgi:hypothetical protein